MISRVLSLPLLILLFSPLLTQATQICLAKTLGYAPGIKGDHDNGGKLDRAGTQNKGVEVCKDAYGDVIPKNKNVTFIHSTAAETNAWYVNFADCPQDVPCSDIFGLKNKGLGDFGNLVDSCQDKKLPKEGELKARAGPLENPFATSGDGTFYGGLFLHKIWTKLPNTKYDFVTCGYLEVRPEPHPVESKSDCPVEGCPA
ncbi:MAG: hypothetical protein M1837_003373 [Sclerophora amabilis]|nr:MAG: hypothetical protein M1837_003373 [Sclerophora amabilis]